MKSLFYRFAPEEKDDNLHSLCHMPFGVGPRSCLGSMLAFLQAKITIISILKEYRFVRSKDTKVSNYCVVVVVNYVID